MAMLHIIDPLGGEQSKRKKLKRRIYRSKVSSVSECNIISKISSVSECNIILCVIRARTTFGTVMVKALWNCNPRMH